MNTTPLRTAAQLWQVQPMKCQLIFRYEFASDGDDFGLLFGQVETPKFKGANSTWVQWQDMRDLATSLDRYPVEADEPIVGAWGFSENGHDTEVTKVVVKPLGLTGGLNVEVLLANDHKPANRCCVEFETDYPTLGKFAGELNLMILERKGSASLNGWTDVT